MSEYLKKAYFSMYGTLFIFRAGSFYECGCPIAGFSSSCHVVCPLMGEPRRVDGVWKLQLCNVELTISGEFEDGRNKTV